MKKDEQANVLLSLKNLYRLFTVKDYPVYSTGILGEKSKKGLTLVKFWDECLLYEWKSTRHGKMIFRKYVLIFTLFYMIGRRFCSSSVSELVFQGVPF